MSTQKGKINDPLKARRSYESIFAEALICRLCKWKAEFLSGGYDSFSVDELVYITKTVHDITGQKQWLNVGTLKKNELEQFLPYIDGVCGTIECINPELRKKLCPSKPMDAILKMFRACDELGLKKTITIIIGIGETEKDIPLLIDFIKKHDIDKVTFYALNPHEQTMFRKGPDTDYYCKWIFAARKEFPNIDIVAGSWVDRLEEIPSLLEAGADNITKFPSIKLFNSRYAKKIEEGIRRAGKKPESQLTGKLKFDIAFSWLEKLKFDKDLERRVKRKLAEYRKRMEKRKKS